MQYNTFLRQDDGFMKTGRYPYSFTKQLNNSIDGFIREFGVLDIDEGYSLSFENLDELEQGELVALYLESIDRDVSECVWGKDFTINSEYVCALIKMLGNPSQENKESFADTIQQNCISYFENSIQDIIDSRCDWVYRDWLENAGFDE